MSNQDKLYDSIDGSENTPMQQLQKRSNVASCLVLQNERKKVEDFPSRNSFYSLIDNSLIVIHAEKNCVKDLNIIGEKICQNRFATKVSYSKLKLTQFTILLYNNHSKKCNSYFKKKKYLKQVKDYFF